MNPFDKARAKYEEQQKQKITERQSAAKAAEAANQAFVEKFEPVLDRLEKLFEPSMEGLVNAGYQPVIERKISPTTMVETALVFTSGEPDPVYGYPNQYRISITVRGNYSTQISCEMGRAEPGEQDSRLVKRHLVRPSVLPPFKQPEFEPSFIEKLERIFTKILQLEPPKKKEYS
ncbi:hypothetical protein [Undibacterium sp.]|uniref:hypothetical protein n=1 Tax=Undibacterium sp. TaxID=1914977 RepID=UPI00374D597B